MDNAQQAAKTSSTAVLDWLKSNWIWIAVAIVIAGAIAFFIWKKRKGNVTAPTPVEGAPAPQISREKLPGQPDL